MRGFYLGAQMNGSDKRRWFRVAPRGLVPRVGKILLGPKTMPIDWVRGFRIGISYEGTPQRSSVSGGLSRPKSGNSLLSRER
jgi:hypothetical protein